MGVIAALGAATSAPVGTAASTGQLTFEGCLTGNTAVTACTPLPGATADGGGSGVHGAHDLAMSADGRNLYLAAGLDAAVSAFARDPATGATNFQGCISSNTSTTACAKTPDAAFAGVNTGLGFLQGIVLSPDGTSLYTASEGSSVAQFSRDPASGVVSYVGCISGNSSALGCTPVSGATPGAIGSPLHDLRSLAISPDGTSVYVGASESAAIAVFSRDPASGALTFAGCLTSNSALAACTAIPGAAPGGTDTALQRIYSVAVSPDGAHVYTASYDGAAVTRFDRDAGGGLTFRDCLTSAANVTGCTALPGATPNGDDSQLDNATSINVTADGRNVYVASEYTAALTNLARDPGTGALSYQECFTGNTNVAACAPVPGATPNGSTRFLSNLEDVLASADGNSVYVISYEASVIRFDRDPATGSLAFRECHTSSTSVVGCLVLPGASAGAVASPLHSAWALALSPDGQFLYASAEASSAVSRFLRERPSNEFSFGKVRRNKRKGIAKLHVIVPGRGALTLAGKGLKTVTRDVPSQGDFRLKVKAKGKKAKKLRKRGKLKVRASVTYAPVGNDARTKSKRIKLVRKPKRRR